MRRKGFTLIELLVVIAIIAILAAILFPVFTRAKQTAQETVCLSNLKQISHALTLYANDNSGRWPTIRAYYPSNTPASFWTNANYGCKWDTKLYNRNTFAKTLQRYVKNAAVFYCPLDAKNASSLSPVAPTSYMYRWLIGWYTFLNGTIAESDFRRPSKQIVFHETTPFHPRTANGNTDYSYGNSSGNASLPPNFNAVYADGHARMWYPLFSNASAKFPYDPNWFCYPQPETADPHVGWDN